MSERVLRHNPTISEEAPEERFPAIARGDGPETIEATVARGPSLIDAEAVQGAGGGRRGTKDPPRSQEVVFGLFFGVLPEIH